MPLVLGDEKQEAEGLPPIQSEMKTYLQDRTIKKKLDAGPLNWRRKNVDRYPKLSTAAKRVLCIHPYPRSQKEYSPRLASLLTRPKVH